MKEEKVFKVKRDFTVLVVYIVLVALTVLFSVFVKRNFVFPVLLAFSCLLTVLYTICVFNSKYVLKKDHILVVHGLIRRKLHYKNIEKLKEKKCFAMPFLSLRNIKIFNSNKFLCYEYICPIDAEEFISEVEDRAEYAKNLINYMGLDNE